MNIEYEENDLRLAEKYHEIGHFLHIDVLILANMLYNKRLENEAVIMEKK